MDDYLQRKDAFWKRKRRPPLANNDEQPNPAAGAADRHGSRQVGGPMSTILEEAFTPQIREIKRSVNELLYDFSRRMSNSNLAYDSAQTFAAASSLHIDGSNASLSSHSSDPSATSHDVDSITFCSSHKSHSIHYTKNAEANKIDLDIPKLARHKSKPRKAATFVANVLTKKSFSNSKIYDQPYAIIPIQFGKGKIKQNNCDPVAKRHKVKVPECHAEEEEKLHKENKRYTKRIQKHTKQHSSTDKEQSPDIDLPVPNAEYYNTNCSNELYMMLNSIMRENRDLHAIACNAGNTNNEKKKRKKKKGGTHGKHENDKHLRIHFEDEKEKRRTKSPRQRYRDHGDVSRKPEIQETKEERSKRKKHKEKVKYEGDTLKTAHRNTSKSRKHSKCPDLRISHPAIPEGGKYTRNTKKASKMYQFLKQDYVDLQKIRTFDCFSVEKKPRATITLAELGSLAIPSFDQVKKAKAANPEQQQLAMNAKEPQGLTRFQDTGTMPVKELCWDKDTLCDEEILKSPRPGEVLQHNVSVSADLNVDVSRPVSPSTIKDSRDAIDAWKTSLTSFGEGSHITIESECEEKPAALPSSNVSPEVDYHPNAQFQTIVDCLFKQPMFDSCSAISVEPYCCMTLNTDVSSRRNKNKRINTDLVWTSDELRIQYCRHAIRKLKPRTSRTRKTIFKKFYNSNKRQKPPQCATWEGSDTVIEEPICGKITSRRKSKIPVFFKNRSCVELRDSKKRMDYSERSSSSSGEHKRSRIPKPKMCNAFSTPARVNSIEENPILQFTRSNIIDALKIQGLEVLLPFTKQKDIPVIDNEVIEFISETDTELKTEPFMIYNNDAMLRNVNLDDDSIMNIECTWDGFDDSSRLKDDLSSNNSEFTNFEPIEKLFIRESTSTAVDLQDIEAKIKSSCRNLEKVKVIYRKNRDSTSTKQGIDILDVSKPSSSAKDDKLRRLHTNTTIIVNLADFVKSPMGAIASRVNMTESIQTAIDPDQQSVSLQVLMPMKHVDTNTSNTTMRKFSHLSRRPHFKSHLPLRIDRPKLPLPQSYTFPVQIDMNRFTDRQTSGESVKYSRQTNSSRSAKITNYPNCFGQGINSLYFQSELHAESIRLQSNKHQPFYKRWWSTLRKKTPKISNVLVNSFHWKANSEERSIENTISCEVDLLELTSTDISTWSREEWPVVSSIRSSNNNVNIMCYKSDARNRANYKVSHMDTDVESHHSSSIKTKLKFRRKKSKPKAMDDELSIEESLVDLNQSSGQLIFDLPAAPDHEHSGSLILKARERAARDAGQKGHSAGADPDIEEAIRQRDRLVALGREEIERRLKELKKEAEEKRGDFHYIFTPIVRGEYGLTYYNFCSPLRNYDLNTENLKMLTPCVKGHMEKAPKVSLSQQASVDPILTVVPSHDCTKHHAEVGVYTFPDEEVAMEVDEHVPVASSVGILSPKHNVIGLQKKNLILFEIYPWYSIEEEKEVKIVEEVKEEIPKPIEVEKPKPRALEPIPPCALTSKTCTAPCQGFSGKDIEIKPPSRLDRLKCRYWQCRRPFHPNLKFVKSAPKFRPRRRAIDAQISDEKHRFRRPVQSISEPETETEPELVPEEVESRPKQVELVESPSFEKKHCDVSCEGISKPSFKRTRTKGQQARPYRCLMKHLRKRHEEQLEVPSRQSRSEPFKDTVDESTSSDQCVCASPKPYNKRKLKVHHVGKSSDARISFKKVLSKLLVEKLASIAKSLHRQVSEHTQVDATCACKMCLCDLDDEDYVLTLNLRRTFHDLVVSFPGHQFKLILTRKLSPKRCYCGVDDSSSLNQLFFETLYERLCKNGEFLRKVRKVLVHPTPELLGTGGERQLALSFITDLMNSIISFDGMYIMDAAKIYFMEMKYRRQCFKDANIKGSKSDMLDEDDNCMFEFDASQPQVNDDKQMQYDTKDIESLKDVGEETAAISDTNDRPAVQVSNEVLCQYESPTLITRPLGKRDLTPPLKQTSYRDVFTHYSNSCSCMHNSSSIVTILQRKARTSKSCTSVSPASNALSIKEVFENASGDTKRSQDRIADSRDQYLREIQHQKQMKNLYAKNSSSEFEHLYKSRECFIPPPIRHYDYVCDEIIIRHPPVLWVLARKMLSRANTAIDSKRRRRRQCARRRNNRRNVLSTRQQTTDDEHELQDTETVSLETSMEGVRDEANVNRKLKLPPAKQGNTRETKRSRRNGPSYMPLCRECRKAQYNSRRKPCGCKKNKSEMTSKQTTQYPEEQCGAVEHEPQETSPPIYPFSDLEYLASSELSTRPIQDVEDFESSSNRAQFDSSLMQANYHNDESSGLSILPGNVRNETSEEEDSTCSCKSQVRKKVCSIRQKRYLSLKNKLETKKGGSKEFILCNKSSSLCQAKKEIKQGNASVPETWSATKIPEHQNDISPKKSSHTLLERQPSKISMRNTSAENDTFIKDEKKKRTRISDNSNDDHTAIHESKENTTNQKAADHKNSDDSVEDIGPDNEHSYDNENLVSKEMPKSNRRPWTSLHRKGRRRNLSQSLFHHKTIETMTIAPKQPMVSMTVLTDSTSMKDEASATSSWVNNQMQTLLTYKPPRMTHSSWIKRTFKVFRKSQAKIHPQIVRNADDILNPGIAQTSTSLTPTTIFPNSLFGSTRYASKKIVSPAINIITKLSKNTSTVKLKPVEIVDKETQHYVFGKLQEPVNQQHTLRKSVDIESLEFETNTLDNQTFTRLSSEEGIHIGEETLQKSTVLVSDSILSGVTHENVDISNPVLQKPKESLHLMDIHYVETDNCLVPHNAKRYDISTNTTVPHHRTQIHVALSSIKIKQTSTYNEDYRGIGSVTQSTHVDHESVIVSSQTEVKETVDGQCVNLYQQTFGVKEDRKLQYVDKAQTLGSKLQLDQTSDQAMKGASVISKEVATYSESCQDVVRSDCAGIHQKRATNVNQVDAGVQDDRVLIVNNTLLEGTKEVCAVYIESGVMIIRDDAQETKTGTTMFGKLLQQSKEGDLSDAQIRDQLNLKHDKGEQNSIVKQDIKCIQFPEIIENSDSKSEFMPISISTFTHNNKNAKDLKFQVANINVSEEEVPMLCKTISESSESAITIDKVRMEITEKLNTEYSNSDLTIPKIRDKSSKHKVKNKYQMNKNSRKDKSVKRKCKPSMDKISSTLDVKCTIKERTKQCNSKSIHSNIAKNSSAKCNRKEDKELVNKESMEMHQISYQPTNKTKKKTSSMITSGLNYCSSNKKNKQQKEFKVIFKKLCDDGIYDEVDKKSFKKLFRKCCGSGKKERGGGVDDHSYWKQILEYLQKHPSTLNQLPNYFTEEVNKLKMEHDDNNELINDIALQETDAQAFLQHNSSTGTLGHNPSPLNDPSESSICIHFHAKGEQVIENNPIVNAPIESSMHASLVSLCGYPENKVNAMMAKTNVLRDNPSAHLGGNQTQDMFMDQQQEAIAPSFVSVDCQTTNLPPHSRGKMQIMIKNVLPSISNKSSRLLRKIPTIVKGGLQETKMKTKRTLRRRRHVESGSRGPNDYRKNINYLEKVEISYEPPANKQQTPTTNSGPIETNETDIGRSISSTSSSELIDALSRDSYLGGEKMDSTLSMIPAYDESLSNETEGMETKSRPKKYSKFLYWFKGLLHAERSRTNQARRSKHRTKFAFPYALRYFLHRKRKSRSVVIRKSRGRNFQCGCGSTTTNSRPCNCSGKVSATCECKSKHSMKKEQSKIMHYSFVDFSKIYSTNSGASSHTSTSVPKNVHRKQFVQTEYSQVFELERQETTEEQNKKHSNSLDDDPRIKLDTVTFTDEINLGESSVTKNRLSTIVEHTEHEIEHEQTNTRMDNVEDADETLNALILDTDEDENCIPVDVAEILNICNRKQSMKNYHGRVKHSMGENVPNALLTNNDLETSENIFNVMCQDEDNQTINTNPVGSSDTRGNIVSRALFALNRKVKISLGKVKPTNWRSPRIFSATLTPRSRYREVTRFSQTSQSVVAEKVKSGMKDDVEFEEVSYVVRTSRYSKTEQLNSQRTINSDISSLKSHDDDSNPYNNIFPNYSQQHLEILKEMFSKNQQGPDSRMPNDDTRIQQEIAHSGRSREAKYSAHGFMTPELYATMSRVKYQAPHDLYSRPLPPVPKGPFLAKKKTCNDKKGASCSFHKTIQSPREHNMREDCFRRRQVVPNLIRRRFSNIPVEVEQSTPQNQKKDTMRTHDNKRKLLQPTQSKYKNLQRGSGCPSSHTLTSTVSNSTARGVQSDVSCNKDHLGLGDEEVPENEQTELSPHKHSTTRIQKILVPSNFIQHENPSNVNSGLVFNSTRHTNSPVEFELTSACSSMPRETVRLRTVSPKLDAFENVGARPNEECLNTDGEDEFSIHELRSSSAVSCLAKPSFELEKLSATSYPDDEREYILKTHDYDICRSNDSASQRKVILCTSKNLSRNNVHLSKPKLLPASSLHQAWRRPASRNMHCYRHGHFDVESYSSYDLHIPHTASTSDNPISVSSPDEFSP